MEISNYQSDWAISSSNALYFRFQLGSLLPLDDDGSERPTVGWVHHGDDPYQVYCSDGSCVGGNNSMLAQPRIAETALHLYIFRQQRVL